MKTSRARPPRPAPTRAPSQKASEAEVPEREREPGAHRLDMNRIAATTMVGVQGGRDGEPEGQGAGAELVLDRGHGAVDDRGVEPEQEPRQSPPRPRSPRRAGAPPAPARQPPLRSAPCPDADAKPARSGGQVRLSRRLFLNAAYQLI